MLYAPEGLLPLMKVDHAILTDINRVEQVLNDGVGRDFLTGELVSLGDQLAEVSECNAAILLSIELFLQKKKGVDNT